MHNWVLLPAPLFSTLFSPNPSLYRIPIISSHSFWASVFLYSKFLMLMLKGILMKEDIGFQGTFQFQILFYCVLSSIHPQMWSWPLRSNSVLGFHCVTRWLPHSTAFWASRNVWKAASGLSLLKVALNSKILLKLPCRPQGKPCSPWVLILFKFFNYSLHSMSFYISFRYTE